jgi:putative ABC transport system permease protein
MALYLAYLSLKKNTMRVIIQFFRFLRKDLFHGLINIIGLTFGLTCSIIIFIYLFNEFTYDRFHDKADRIWRISQNYVTSGKPKKFAISSPALGPALLREYPQVEAFVRIKQTGRILCEYENKIFYERNIHFADSTLFKVFDYKMIIGDPATCLVDPGNIILSKSLAEKYFGKSDPTGKHLIIENQYDAMVSGVFEDPPANTHIPVDAFISYSTWDAMAQVKSTEWSFFEIYDHTYLLFYNDFDRQAFDRGWPAFYKKYLEEDGEVYGQVYEPMFHRLPDIHYKSDLPGDFPTGNYSFLYALLFIGLFILVLAGINFVNMSTARATMRIREAGIRKMHGAGRSKLVFRFIAESVILSFLSMIMALALVEFIFSFTGFNSIIGKELNLNILNNGSLMAGILVITLIFGILASLYPAFYLSRYTPSETISKLFSLGTKGILVRQVLVIAQIILGTVAITFTFLINSQIKFLEKSPLGFERNNLILVEVRDSLLETSLGVLINDLKTRPDVKSVTTGYNYPGYPAGGLYWFEGDGEMEEHNIPAFFINYNYFNTLGLELVAGRDFAPEFVSDTSAGVIINEKLAGYMNWEEPLGKKITQFRNLDATVVGVVKDFHFRSLHNKIEPLLIRLVDSYYGYLIIRSGGSNTSGLLKFLEKSHNEIIPDRPFEYFFLDDEFNKLYRSDRSQLKVISLFSIICIVIATLGIFGLISFTTERKTKEIGIRKVNGATVSDILSLVAKQFLVLTLIAIAIAIPVSIWLFTVWVREFAYQVRIQPVILVGMACLALLISFISIIYHSLKASTANPVRSLRYE